MAKLTLPEQQKQSIGPLLKIVGNQGPSVHGLGGRFASIWFVDASNDEGWR